MLAKVKRDYAVKSDTAYTSAYGADTWTMNRMTVNLGLRWDRQAALARRGLGAGQHGPPGHPALGDRHRDRQRDRLELGHAARRR